MTTFLQDLIADINKKGLNLSNTTFILPSKRAGHFLKKEIMAATQYTLFAPEILSIEEFIEELSGLKSISNAQLLFEFYHTYTLINTKTETDSFEKFSKWAQIVLQDFNEIDRYKVNHENIFNYLSAIKELEHWSKEKNQTTFIKNYLAFWNKLKNYYTCFSETLISKKIGYQGLLYREAEKNTLNYIKHNAHKNFVFAGFNALNTCEELIFQKFLERPETHIYWDIDMAFITNKDNDAGLFTRKYNTNWPYYKANPFNWLDKKNYNTPKNIQVYGIPKNVGQAKQIGCILNDIQKTNPEFKSTAVVLGDENLLMPILNALPTHLNGINITMGLPLKSVSMAWLFENLFQLHRTVQNNRYYKDVINIITHQYIRPLFYYDETDYALKIVETIEKENIIYISVERLLKIASPCQNIINLLFSSWNNEVAMALHQCETLIQTIKPHLQNNTHKTLDLEYLFRFHEIFNELQNLNNNYKYLTNISTLHLVYKELLRKENLDFKGEPLQGLQIMGMLESRVLDYETLIISSVNEGILPSGKSNSSFIPFDVKKQHKLPTYKEKDAVYTYHFYRLIQRAKNIHILYNTEVEDNSTGEKSRFLTQMEIAGDHHIKHTFVVTKINPIDEKLLTVVKNEAVISKLKTYAAKGFSPSALNTYILNPIDFYNSYILDIKAYKYAEETIAANILGTVVHNTLEKLYLPFCGEPSKILTETDIKNLKPEIETALKVFFKKEYGEGNIDSGKNKIIYEVAKRYVENFLNLEIEAIKNGNEIIIKNLEYEAQITLNIPELNFPISLKCKIDRIDTFNGITRIIDYKTGRVESKHITIKTWENICDDYSKSKSIQLLCYAYLLHTKNECPLPAKVGIISFKNLTSGFIPLKTENDTITLNTLLAFEHELFKLIIEIFNPEIPFNEKEIIAFTK